MHYISALVPAFNESDKIRDTVAALKEITEIKEIIVVDDGSTDNTASLARQSGARVIRSCRNLGKGEAVWLGSLHAAYPLLALVDADLGSSAGEVRHLMRPVFDGEAEMTVAVFPRNRKRGGLGMVKTVARWGLKLLTGIRFDEPLSGQRVLKSEILKNMKTPARGFGLEVALTLFASRQGYRIKEVPTMMAHREGGKDPVSLGHRGRQLIAVLRELWLGLVKT